MGVGGFLHRQIEPVTGVAVGPHLHALQQILFIFRCPVQNTVNHGHGLCPGDIGIRAEGAVRKALNPAQLRGTLNILLRPVAADVGERPAAAADTGIEPGTDGRELSAGDRCLGIEGCSAAALHNAQTRDGGNRRVGPVVIGHVRVGVAGQQIVVPNLVRQQAEEDGGGLRTGNQAVGVDIAVAVALNVGKVILIVQHAGSFGGRPTGVQGHHSFVDLP